MYHGGIKRAETMMANAEDKGRAVTNPYASELIDQYVMPLAQAVNNDLIRKGPGVRQAHVALLGAIDPEAVAALAVRAAINHVLGEGEKACLRSTATAIGTSIHNELVLDQIADTEPALYHTLSRDFNRRLSKDERHRMTVFKMQARKAGVNVIEWPVGARAQVGIYLLGLLDTLGLIEIEPDWQRGHGYVRKPRLVTLSLPVVERIAEVKGFVAITMPTYGPCVEPPRDWINPGDGGFHTRELRRTHPTLIRHRMARSDYCMNTPMPLVLDAVNALQRTRWAVNERMLDTVLAVAAHFEAGEITSRAAKPKPEALPWLKDVDTKAPRAAWPDIRKSEFKQWKRTMADWYTDRKLAAVRFGRFYAATRGAEMFRGYPAIHFVYFADSRGRLYPMTYGLNPQGSDLQRGLLHFADGLPLADETAQMWFCVHGANKFGFDKATLEERQAWVMERADLIESFAENPLDNRGWKDAGDPVQFLAWAFEFRDWRRQPAGFVSRLPISMDGSCNGLQNLSALLRDEIGGEATNLTANSRMQDIYARVAAAATRRLETTSYDDMEKESLRVRWLQHGINRTVVKRSVMTTPYGVTKRSAADYVVEDYLKRNLDGGVFDRSEWPKAAAVLMDSVWPAIGDVVVKGREAMDWLKKSARLILKGFGPDEEPVVMWRTPSGFPSVQSYWEVEVHRINTKLHGDMKVRVLTEKDEADVAKHCNGMAPNFVHSMDASHLHLTTAACRAVSIDHMAMIHDDYGTHAANAQKLYDLIRQKFVWMYENHDPIVEFAAKYPGLPKPPEKGSLDIREVLESRYFFS